MPPADTASREDHELARRLAVEAGELLVALRADLGDRGVSPKELKDEGDRRSNEYLIDALGPRLDAGDQLLSEESAATHGSARLDTSRVWIIDPLDGTREFSEPPRWDWAVHVALCIDGAPVCGAVSLPAVGQVFSTADSAPEMRPAPATPRIVVSRTRPPAEAEMLCEQLGGVLVPMGSAGAKTMSLLRDEADCYPHSGGQYEWDSAAPVAVALHYGFHASRLDGSPLRYNSADPYLPDLLICHPTLTSDCLAALGGA